jgi:hypothetical protein
MSAKWTGFGSTRLDEATFTHRSSAEQDIDGLAPRYVTGNVQILKSRDFALPPAHKETETQVRLTYDSASESVEDEKDIPATELVDLRGKCRGKPRTYELI